MHQIANRPAPDLGAVKARHQAMWAAGDCGRIGVQLQIVGERLCEAVDLGAADRVLDVAAGNGNASLAAARHFADVTSTDYVPALLEQGRLRAEADGLPITCQVADAEALPFDDASFDVGHGDAARRALRPGATDIRTRRRTYTFRYRSAEHWVEFFRSFYGPTHKAFAALDEAGRQALHAALLDLLARSHRGNGGGFRVPGEYLEAVVTR